MALAIAWRNPIPVHASKRCVKFERDEPTGIYLVQELIAGAEEQRWASTSVLELPDIRAVFEENRETDSEPQTALAQPHSICARQL
jgi:hypothetical protein